MFGRDETLRAFRPRLMRLEDRMAPASFQGLGFLPGDTYSYAWGLSADGSVAVGSSTNSGPGGRAIRWTAAGGMADLGALPGANGGNANDCSTDGSVIVGTGYTLNGNHAEAWRWTAATGMVAIPNLPDQLQSDARGVSADGSVVVGQSDNTLIIGPHRAWRWSAAGGTTDLGFLPSGLQYAEAHSVSADGSVVVGMAYDNFWQAFRWTAASGMVGLGGGGNAYRVSPDGTIMVGCTDVGGGQAYRWTAADGFVGLGTQGGFSFADDLSADGSVIVGVSGSGAFIWTPSNGMRDLRTVLINDYGLGAQLAGWTLQDARACSDDGRVIVGNALGPDGNSQGWIARLDAPPSVTGTQVNDGSVQRSRVTSLTVAFSAPVSFASTPSAAFTLTRNFDNVPVLFTASATVINGVTVVALTNFTGLATQFGSLADGRYTLTVLASQISAGGQQMTSDYTFGDAQGLFRYFGDINGDRHVDIADFGLFATSYGQHVGQPGFLAAFDFNGNGVVDIADFGQFAIRMFTVLP